MVMTKGVANLLMAMAAAWLVPASEGAYPESVVHAFGGGTDGAIPGAALLEGSDGNFYGTTSVGGTGDCPGGCGTVFRIANPTTSPALTTIHSFAGGADGETPDSALIQASDGSLYGTTFEGGANDQGTVFRIRSPATSPNEAVIYAFTGGADGGRPYGSLIQAADGHLYGTTTAGGSAGYGTVFEVSDPAASPAQTVIYSFAGGSDGATPYAALIQFPDGDLYGTTTAGGSANNGTVFKISRLATSPVETVVYAFAGGSDGATPYAALTRAADGDLYGTTSAGGSGNNGTVFKISDLTASPIEVVIHSFAGGTDGVFPFAGLIQGSNGDLYGTTAEGGAGSCVDGCGTVFRIRNPGTSPAEIIPYAFTGGSDGETPNATLIQTSDGNYYGTTSFGGASGLGTVFRMEVPARGVVPVAPPAAATVAPR